MLYNDLLRLNTVDREIQSRLEEIAALYKERSGIMQQQAGQVAEKLPPSAEALYESLSQKWGRIGVTIPAFKTLKTKLQTALDLAQKKSGADVASMYIVLVPPTKQLLESIRHRDAPAVDIQSYLSIHVPQKNTWRVALVQNNAERKLVEGLEAFLKQPTEADDIFRSFDTGAQLVTAAFLQGVKLVQKGSWNLLLADRTSLHEVPCARLVNDTLTFSIDDSDGFLGLNYYYPSLFIGGKKA